MGYVYGGQTLALPISPSRREDYDGRQQQAEDGVRDTAVVPTRKVKRKCYLKGKCVDKGVRVHNKKEPAQYVPTAAVLRMERALS